MNGLFVVLLASAVSDISLGYEVSTTNYYLSHHYMSHQRAFTQAGEACEDLGGKLWSPGGKDEFHYGVDLYKITSGWVDLYKRWFFFGWLDVAVFGAAERCKQWSPSRRIELIASGQYAYNITKHSSLFTDAPTCRSTGSEREQCLAYGPITAGGYGVKDDFCTTRLSNLVCKFEDASIFHNISAGLEQSMDPSRRSFVNGVHGFEKAVGLHASLAFFKTPKLYEEAKETCSRNGWVLWAPKDIREIGVIQKPDDSWFEKGYWLGIHLSTHGRPEYIAPDGYIFDNSNKKLWGAQKPPKDPSRRCTINASKKKSKYGDEDTANMDYYEMEVGFTECDGEPRPFVCDTEKKGWDNSWRIKYMDEKPSDYTAAMLACKAENMTFWAPKYFEEMQHTLNRFSYYGVQEKTIWLGWKESKTYTDRGFRYNVFDTENEYFEHSDAFWGDDERFLDSDPECVYANYTGEVNWYENKLGWKAFTGACNSPRPFVCWKKGIHVDQNGKIYLPQGAYCEKSCGITGLKCMCNSFFGLLAKRCACAPETITPSELFKMIYDMRYHISNIEYLRAKAQGRCSRTGFLGSWMANECGSDDKYPCYKGIPGC